MTKQEYDEIETILDGFEIEPEIRNRMDAALERDYEFAYPINPELGIFKCICKRTYRKCDKENFCPNCGQRLI